MCGEQIETQYFDSIHITGQPKTKVRTISTDPVRYLCYDTQHNMVVKGTKTNRKQNLEEVVIKKTPRNAKQGN
jgi:hypothetical protein